MRWLVGLRRAHIERRILRRFGPDGVVWVPDATFVCDVEDAVRALCGDGAKPDLSLVWDIAVTDVRGACDQIDGHVAMWVHPDRLADPGRAAAHARELAADVRRDNVAVAFAWDPSRAGALSSIVAAGIAVAVSNVTDERPVREAHARGMERLRKEATEDEEVEDVPLFVLGETVGETGLWAEGRGVPPSLPSDAASERAAFDAVLAALADVEGRGDTYAPDAFDFDVRYGCDSLDRADVCERIWSRDHTLWNDEPDEIADRLGWLDVAETMRGRTSELQSFAREARSGGVERVVLLGMGGSSLAPETFAATMTTGVKLTVLDTTDPDHVSGVLGTLQPERTVFVVSSKSGTTVETLSHLELFWDRVRDGRRFVAVTDPGTPLAALAADRGFLRCFENPPDIGGRYSALSYFGLVPAALCGIDVAAILDAGIAMARACAGSVPAERSPAARLASALGAAHTDGRDKLTLVDPFPLGPWIEQLIAESTGKEGTGIVPVAGEPLGGPDVYGDDRIFVASERSAELDALAEAGHPVVVLRRGPVGAEMFLWELATAIAGYQLGIHPFDQPDVEAAKVRAREALGPSGPAPPDRGDAKALLDGAEAPSYVAIQAFVPYATASRLEAVRVRLRDRLKVATTVGFGPRFLHSTGQLHKGGPDTGIFLQVTGRHATDVEVPQKGYTFGRLLDAQADGDLLALRDAGRRAARLSLEELEGL